MGRLRNIFRLGRLKGHGSRGFVQTEGLDGEIHSSLRHPQSYGVESKPPVESETYTLYQEGNQDQGAVLVVAGQAPITLADGETVVYSSGGATVHCKGATIELNGSAFGGLIKINDQIAELNNRVAELQAHTHFVIGTGADTATPTQTFSTTHG
jgi:phage gp45-like